MRLPVLPLIAMSVLLLSGPVHAGNDASPAGDTPTDAPADAAMIDALARDLGITAEAAQARLDAQAMHATLLENLRTDIGDAFAGAWLGDDGLTLHIAATDADIVHQLLASGIRATHVKLDATQLAGIQYEVDKILSAYARFGGTTYIDVPNNRVVAEVLPKLIPEVTAQIEFQHLAAVSVLPTRGTPQTYGDVLGGNGYAIGPMGCSVGFAVAGGFLTAGHCAIGPQTTHPGGSFAGVSFPGDDYAWVRITDGSTPVPRVNTYGGAPLDVRGSQEALIGAAVCRSGATTGWSCGVIAQRDVTVDFAPHLVYGLVATNACATHGDSGGPYMAGNQAQGMLSGGTINCTTYYQPVREALAAYNLTLLTTPDDNPPPRPIDHAPFGSFDEVTSTPQGTGFRVIAWGMDEDLAPRTTPSHMDISVDGHGTPRVLANRPRPDVGAAYPGFGNNHGLDVVINAGPGLHNVCVSVQNYRALGSPTPAANTSLGCKPVFVSAAPPVEPEGEVTSVMTGKCMDVAGGSAANGTPVWMYACNGTGAQHWQIRNDFTVRAFDKCLDVANGATANHAGVQLYDCNGTGAQTWVAHGDRTLRNPQSGRCLDVVDMGTADGTPLQLYDCFGAANQQWNLPQ